MALNNERYFRTFFVAPIEGQVDLWFSELGSQVLSSDKVIGLGNFLGCNDMAKDRVTKDDELGPNSKVMSIIAELNEKHHDFTQLIGANEMMILNLPDEWSSFRTNTMLLSAWVGDKSFLKFAVEDKGRLVTHGGLTHGEWASLGRPQDAKEAADLLNEKYAHNLYLGPSFVLTGVPNYCANAVFADVAMELIPSWIVTDDVCPFDQVTGSGALNFFPYSEALNQEFSPVKYVDSVRFSKFGSIATIKGATFTSLHYDMPKDVRLKKMPETAKFYVEKTDLSLLSF